MEWGNFFQEFRRLESLLSIKKKLKNAFPEVRVGENLDGFLGANR